ncbi:unnamed protein product [Vitrella brassicaformis CCMP3155]|uniref:Uncharacterized protein n=1 Tax=Vitrella brassicaformis (strain CCMP3155) TaxID=1169540 RepID=A0A0G4GYS3_VITBC|nr:unnamed protein product [Vitrella brassicaformis CCMP3155]|eukprot:CEM36084.1 unnamed protein product [Vitrella brassicaformis CCMP3155]
MKGILLLVQELQPSLLQDLLPVLRRILNDATARLCGTAIMSLVPKDSLSADSKVRDLACDALKTVGYVDTHDGRHLIQQGLDTTKWTVAQATLDILAASHQIPLPQQTPLPPDTRTSASSDGRITTSPARGGDDGGSRGSGRETRWWWSEKRERDLRDVEDDEDWLSCEDRATAYAENRETLWFLHQHFLHAYFTDVFNIKWRDRNRLPSYSQNRVPLRGADLYRFKVMYSLKNHDPCSPTVKYAVLVTFRSSTGIDKRGVFCLPVWRDVMRWRVERAIYELQDLLNTPKCKRWITESIALPSHGRVPLDPIRLLTAENELSSGKYQHLISVIEMCSSSRPSTASGRRRGVSSESSASRGLRGSRKRARSRDERRDSQNVRVGGVGGEVDVCGDAAAGKRPKNSLDI